MEKYPEWFPATPMTKKEMIIFGCVVVVIEAFLIYCAMKSKKRKRYTNNVRNRNR